MQKITIKWWTARTMRPSGGFHCSEVWFSSWNALPEKVQRFGYFCRDVFSSEKSSDNIFCFCNLTSDSPPSTLLKIRKKCAGILQNSQESIRSGFDFCFFSISYFSFSRSELNRLVLILISIYKHLKSKNMIR